MIYVLILIVNMHAIAMHDFGSKQACENALTAALTLRPSGVEHSIRGICVPKK